MMKKKISIKSLSIILLSLVILSMLIIASHQNNQLDNLNKKTVNPEIIVTKANVMTEKKSPDAEPLSEKRRLQYEKAISQLKSQINEIQTTKEISDNKPQQNDRYVAVQTDYFDGFYTPFLDELGVSNDDILEILDRYLWEGCPDRQTYQI